MDISGCELLWLSNYLILLDDCSHFSWSFPLHKKSDTSTTLQQFFSFVKTQYNVVIKALQCDNGGEFINSTLRSFFSTNGIAYHFSCPHTSPQNGKSRASYLYHQWRNSYTPHPSQLNPSVLGSSSSHRHLSPKSSSLSRYQWSHPLLPTIGSTSHIWSP